MNRSITVMLVAFALSGVLSADTCTPIIPLECQGTGWTIDWGDWHFDCYSEPPNGCCEVKWREGDCKYYGDPRGTVYEQLVDEHHTGSCGTQCVPFSP